MIIVLTTTPDITEAERLATLAVEKRLAGCVQILPDVTSIYEWEDEVVKEREFLVVIKSVASKWDELKELIEAEHSYSVPEIVSLGTEQVSEKYGKWLKSVVGK